MNSCYDGDHLVRLALSTVLEHGRMSAPRGKRVLEVHTPTVFTLVNPAMPLVTTPGRRANYRFGMSEALWILSGSEDLEPMARHNNRMREFSDDGQTLWGAYGPRVVGQLPHVIASLGRDEDSRQAVLTTWRPQVGFVTPMYPASGKVLKAAGLPYGDRLMGCPEWEDDSWRSKDTPCTVAWHFMIRGGALNLTVFMRSNDAWLGTPYDILSFTTIQRAVAAVIGVPVGHYHHVVSNLHLYDEHVDKARAMLDEPPGESIRLPAFTPEVRTLEYVVDSARLVLDGVLMPLADLGMTAYGAVIHNRHSVWPMSRSVPVRQG